MRNVAAAASQSGVCSRCRLSRVACSVRGVGRLIEPIQFVSPAASSRFAVTARTLLGGRESYAASISASAGRMRSETMALSRDRAQKVGDVCGDLERLEGILGSGGGGQSLSRAKDAAVAHVNFR